MTGSDVETLREKVRQAILAQVAEWRGEDPVRVDALAGGTA
jgi:hypothetical protein